MTMTETAYPFRMRREDGITRAVYTDGGNCWVLIDGERHDRPGIDPAWVDDDDA
jgi:hypothetical protein